MFFHIDLPPKATPCRLLTAAFLARRTKHENDLNDQVVPDCTRNDIYPVDGSCHRTGVRCDKLPRRQPGPYMQKIAKKRAISTNGRTTRLSVRRSLKLHKDFPGRSAVPEELAGVEARLGNDTAALEWLRQTIEMGLIPQADGPAAAALNKLAQSEVLSKRLEQNRKAVFEVHHRVPIRILGLAY